MSPNDEVRCAFTKAIAQFEMIADIQPRLPNKSDDVFEVAERANRRLLAALQDYNTEARVFKRAALIAIPEKP